MFGPLHLGFTALIAAPWLERLKAEGTMYKGRTDGIDAEESKRHHHAQRDECVLHSSGNASRAMRRAQARARAQRPQNLQTRSRYAKPGR